MQRQSRTPSPPRTVFIACALVLVSYVLTGFRIYLKFSNPERYLDDLLVVSVITLALFWAFALSLPFVMMAGRNWARIAFLVFAVSGATVLTFETEWVAGPSPAHSLLGWIQWGFQIVAAVLLFLPASERWFMAMKAHYRRPGGNVHKRCNCAT